MVRTPEAAMLLRIVASVSVALAGVLVLYFPSTRPPEYFVEQLRREHDLAVQFWGSAHAMRIVARMLDMQDGADQKEASGAGPLTRVLTGSQPDTLDSAVTAELGA